MNMTSVCNDEMFKLIRKDNELRGKQRITEWYMSGDEIVFSSNAKGGYGETLTFHYTCKHFSEAVKRLTGLPIRDDGYAGYKFGVGFQFFIVK